MTGTSGFGLGVPVFFIYGPRVAFHYGVSMEDPESDAFGPLVHGCSILLLPDVRDCGKLRSAYLETLRLTQCPYSDNPSDFEDPSDIYQGPVPSWFLSYGNRSMIYHPEGGEHTAQLISTLLPRSVVLVQPLGKAWIWTYVIYRDGHMVDRYASCPEWIPEGNLGDPDFEDYENVHGREKALRDYMRTWQGNPQFISDLFDVRVSEHCPYLRQFTLAELEEWGELRKKYAEHKVRSDDRYSIASPWVFVHFIEQLGFPGFRDTYFDVERRRQCSGAPPAHSPAQHKGPSINYERPLCAIDPFPFGGFFWNHEAICGKAP